jgi:hypothetical protein
MLLAAEGGREFRDRGMEVKKVFYAMFIAL